jgi:hypothetical protein
MLLGRINVDKNKILQGVMRTNRLLSFVTRGISYKNKRKNRGETHTEQGDLMDLKN